METKENLTLFNPNSSGDYLFRGIYKHHIIILKEFDPAEHIVSFKSFKKQIISEYNLPYFKTYYFLSLEEKAEKEVKGVLKISIETKKSPSYNTNKNLAWLTISVLPKYRRQGLASSMLKNAFQKLKKENPRINKIFVVSNSKTGDLFLKAIGGKVVLKKEEKRLYMKDINFDKIKRWQILKNIDIKKIKITIAKNIPSEDIKKFCETYSELINSAPRGRVNEQANFTPQMLRYRKKYYKENGIINIILYLKYENKIVGITEIIYSKNQPNKIEQMITGINKNFRGKGLGKFIKSKMLFYIKNKFKKIDYILTQNADSNKSMNIINKKLGFKKFCNIKIFSIRLS